MEVVGLITSDSGAGKRNAPIHGYGDAHYVVAGARGKIDRDPGHVLVGANALGRDAGRNLLAVVAGKCAILVHPGKSAVTDNVGN